MTRNKKTPAKPEAQKARMYPSLHRQVTQALADTNGSEPVFIKKHSVEKYEQQYSTNVMGRFTCENTSCNINGWGSKRVAIKIRKYTGNGYNALVFNQRCKACIDLGSFTLDTESYVERVSYRILKWAGVVLKPPPFKGKKGPPHMFKLCEGCKAGVCPELLGDKDSNRLRKVLTYGGY